MVHAGLEEIAAEEIERELGGEVKRTAPGIVVFRLEEIDTRILSLRTTEDVFLLAWGTDQLSYRAEDRVGGLEDACSRRRCCNDEVVGVRPGQR